MSCEGFSNGYLELSPDKASLLELLRLLCFHDIEKRSFIECPKGAGIRDFKRRWIIFISILAQKILLSLRKPMSWVGSVFELWLNHLSFNFSFAAFLQNLFQGKMIELDKTSETFTSITGNLDKRVELDKSINYGDGRYYGELSIMAAKIAYENEAFVKTVVRDHWKMDFLGFYNFWNDYQDQPSTQAFMLHDKRAEPGLIVVAFRGTEPFNAEAWCTDFDISWYELPGVGNVHGGFMKALGLQKALGWPKEIEQKSKKYAYYTIRDKLREMLREKKEAKFILTGHSLGGALAILFSLVLALHEEAWILERLEGIYTFGQPRVGDEKLGEFMKEKLKVYGVKYLRFVYCNDIVPRLPYDDSTLLFKHFGMVFYYNSFYKGKIMLEEPNKNYFSILMVIPKILNAVWELVRSFIIPYIKGKEYEEGWFLRMLRLIGLVLPGLPAHCLQDYDNATRLGYPILSLELGIKNL